MKIRLELNHADLDRWLDVAVLEVERELAKRQLLRKIRRTIERERAKPTRCACGDPGVCPPCSYCERGSDET